MTTVLAMPEARVGAKVEGMVGAWAAATRDGEGGGRGEGD